jgi:hypothetical protein
MFEDLFGCDVDELDTAAVLTAAATSRALRERLEVLDLLHALRIADLHHEVRATAGRGGERRRVYGGAGCPEIAEFAPVEFGAVMGMSPAAAKAYLDDALGLRHRLPLTFARVLAFDASAWRARKIARACRALPEQAAALVDRRVAAIVNTVAAAYERRALGIASHWPFESWGRFLPEHTTAVSLLDRLLHHANVVVTDGDSYRMREARTKGGTRLNKP